MATRLYRTRDDRMIWGVCGGLAQYFAVDPAIVRVVMILLIFANGLGILLYLVLAIVTPLEPGPAEKAADAHGDSAADPGGSAGEIPSAPRGQESVTGDDAEARGSTYDRRRMAIGIILLAIGILFTAINFGLIAWFRRGLLWPLILVVVALIILLAPRR